MRKVLRTAQVFSVQWVPGEKDLRKGRAFQNDKPSMGLTRRRGSISASQPSQALSVGVECKEESGSKHGGSEQRVEVGAHSAGHIK